jgi:hypothetical protein
MQSRRRQATGDGEVELRRRPRAAWLPGCGTEAAERWAGLVFDVGRPRGKVMD